MNFNNLYFKKIILFKNFKIIPIGFILRIDFTIIIVVKLRKILEIFY